jgi:hypothetical protein
MHHDAEPQYFEKISLGTSKVRCEDNIKVRLGEIDTLHVWLLDLFTL